MASSRSGSVRQSRARIVAIGERSVSGAGKRRPVASLSIRYPRGLLYQRHMPSAPSARAEWLDRAAGKIRDCNLVFLDPDNGLQPERFRPTGAKANKSASFADLSRFSHPGRTLIVYHHHTRRKGGHTAETCYNADRLRNPRFPARRCFARKSLFAESILYFERDRSNSKRGPRPSRERGETGGLPGARIPRKPSTRR